MGETKTISIRVPQEIVEYLEGKEMGMNGAIVDCIEKVMYIEKYAMRDLHGKLTPSEWKYIVDSLNGTLIDGDFRYLASALIAHIEDADVYEGLGGKWSVDVKTLCDKIKLMSSATVDALYRRVEDYWKQPIDLEEWAKF